MVINAIDRPKATTIRVLYHSPNSNMGRNIAIQTMWWPQSLVVSVASIFVEPMKFFLAMNQSKNIISSRSQTSTDISTTTCYTAANNTTEIQEEEEWWSGSGNSSYLSIERHTGRRTTTVSPFLVLEHAKQLMYISFTCLITPYVKHHTTYRIIHQKHILSRSINIPFPQAIAGMRVFWCVVICYEDAEDVRL
jgi:hypothetical protein